LGQHLSRILLQCAATGELPIERVRSEIGLERLHAAAAIGPGELPPIDVQQLDQVRGSYGHLRPAMHAVLDAVQLRGATSADDELLSVLKRVRALRGRFVDEPVELVPKAWRAWVCDEDGRVHRTRLELGLWFVVRDALRAGRLFRPVGRRYADPPGSSCRRSAGKVSATSSPSRSGARWTPMSACASSRSSSTRRCAACRTRATPAPASGSPLVAWSCRAPTRSTRARQPYSCEPTWIA
jgi:hypothetical protein